MNATKKILFFLKKLKKYGLVYNNSSLNKGISYKVDNEFFFENRKFQNIFPDQWVCVPFPRSPALINSGYVELFHPKSAIFKISNGQQAAGSDLVIDGQKAYYPKKSRPQAAKEIVTDSNLNEYFKEMESVEIKLDKNPLNVGSVFSLLGCASHHWAHFLVEYFPKIILCKELIDTGIDILIDSRSDNHIVEMVRAATGNKNRVIKVDPGRSVFCKDLYYCSPVSYLCNHANYVSICDIVIPNETRMALRRGVEEVKKYFNLTHCEAKIQGPRNLYIQYDGNRSPQGENEFRQKLEALGFLCVKPHVLSLKEKIELFMSAENIVGIGSSGFTNIVFCGHGVRVCSIINFQRVFDTYLAQVTSDRTNTSVFVVPGDREFTDDINSPYSVNYDYLFKFLSDNHFFDDLCV